METISIIAIVLGPILAVQVEKLLSRINERKRSREQIFKTLMATRGSTLSLDHVSALNRIDLEFSNTKKRYKRVLSAWKSYFDHLSNHDKQETNSLIWANDNNKLLVELLYEMGKSLKYDFDRALISRNIYSPVGHIQVEKELQEIRILLLSILKGEKSFPMEIVNTADINEHSAEQVENQVKLQELMIDYYTNNKPWRVIIEKEPNV